MKSKYTFISGLMMIFLFLGTSLVAQENDAEEVTGPTLRIISGFEGGSNYQMAEDIQRMTRATLGTPIFETTTEIIPKLNSNGDTIREENLDGEMEMVTEEKITKLPTGDTIDFIKVLASEGSYYNFLKINKSGADMAFLQYDVLLYEAMQDLKRRFKKTEPIRILLPMGTEQIHIVVLK